MYKSAVLLCLALCAWTLAQNTNDLETLKKTITDKLDGGDLNLNVEEAQEVLKQKCIKEGNAAAYDNILVAKEHFQTCLTSIVDVDKLKAEIEDAKPTGELDVVFKKYCQKTPLLKDCVSNLTDAFEPCLNEKEQANKKIIMNITESLANFICFKEGDRIALFIAEGGPECLEEKQEAIQDCVNKTMSKYLPKETPTINDLPELVMKTEQCEDMVKLQNCIVTELESCKEPTPSNIAESLFKFIRKVTPCEKQSQPPASTNRLSSTSAATSVVLSTAILALTALLLV